MSRLNDFDLLPEGEEGVEAIVDGLGLRDPMSQAMETTEAEFMMKPKGYMDQGYRFD